MEVKFIKFHGEKILQNSTKNHLNILLCNNYKILNQDNMELLGFLLVYMKPKLIPPRDKNLGAKGNENRCRGFKVLEILRWNRTLQKYILILLKIHLNLIWNKYKIINRDNTVNLNGPYEVLSSGLHKVHSNTKPINNLVYTLIAKSNVNSCEIHDARNDSKINFIQVQKWTNIYKISQSTRVYVIIYKNDL